MQMLSDLAVFLGQVAALFLIVAPISLVLFSLG